MLDRQPTLESDLLVLRPLTPDDYEPLFAIASDPLLWEQHPAKERAEPEGFRRWFDDAIASGGALVAVDRASGEVIGTSRYDDHDPVRRDVEIGWTFLARRLWGGPYNGEMKRLMLEHAAGAVDSVRFRVHSENRRSQKAVGKLGARRIGTQVDPRGHGVNLVYRLPVSSVYDRPVDTVRVAGTAVVVGGAEVGDRVLVAEGAVLRSARIGAGSAVLENCVVVGAEVGRRTVFGHRCVVAGATVGDLCEIGNASVLMPGARLGDRVFLGEGTVVPAGAVLPSDSVAVGRPARVIRTASADDIERLRGLRDGDLTLPPPTTSPLDPTEEAGAMAHLFPYRGTVPSVDPTAVLFPSAELTGDVVVGPRTIIGAGVKVVGDSHGPVRIGADVQLLENTVLHLLPDNELVIEDGVVVGPGAMIHGCHLGAGTVVEPGAIVCDGSVVGARSVVRAGAVVKQRASFPEGSDLDGFPARRVGDAPPPARPPWAFDPADLPGR